MALEVAHILLFPARMPLGADWAALALRAPGLLAGQCRTGPPATGQLSLSACALVAGIEDV